MDSTAKQVFFELLRMGLWKTQSEIIFPSLNDEQWNQIYIWARQHTVEGLLFDSFNLLPEHNLPSQKIRLKWTIRLDQIERYNRRMNTLIAAQYKLFNTEQLNPILLKGQGVAACYKSPLLRVCGDIDWYFDQEKYDSATALLTQKKIAHTHTAGFSLEYGSNGIQVEHHRRLFDLHSPLKQAFLKNLERKYRLNQQNCTIDDTDVTLLAPELQILQVNSHILKHLLSFGIGLRQCCDAAVLYHFYANKIDKKALEGIYRRLGILSWIHLLHQVLVEQLGLPVECLPFPYPRETKSQWMLEDIWQSGNFGFHDSQYGEDFTSSNQRNNTSGRIWASAKRYFKYAPQEAIFFPITHLYSKLKIK